MPPMPSSKRAPVPIPSMLPGPPETRPANRLIGARMTGCVGVGAVVVVGGVDVVSVVPVEAGVVGVVEVPVLVEGAGVVPGVDGTSAVVVGVVSGVEGDVAVTGGTATVGGATTTVLSPPPLPPHPTKASAHKLPQTTARARKGLGKKMLICIADLPRLSLDPHRTQAKQCGYPEG